MNVFILDFIWLGNDDEIPFWNYTSISLDTGSLEASQGHQGGSRGLRGQAASPPGGAGDTEDNCDRHVFPPRLVLRIKDTLLVNLKTIAAWNI